MKTLSLVFVFGLSGLVLAQEQAAPAEAKPAPATPAELAPLPDPAAPDESELMRNQPGGRLKPAPQRESSLVPEGIVPFTRTGERVKGRSTLRPPATSAELAARIRFREAHSKAAREPGIVALWDDSRQVPTDGEKREALRRYYGALYKRILSLDKSIAPLVQERQRVSLRRLDQTRIEPTDPLDEEHRMRRD